MIEKEDIPLLLEAIQELLYQISLRLEALKGGPLTDERLELTRKQQHLEAIRSRLFQV